MGREVRRRRNGAKFRAVYYSNNTGPNDTKSLFFCGAILIVTRNFNL
jgi:hypothetical protein